MPQIHSNTATELLDWSYSNLNMAQDGIAQFVGNPDRLS